MVYVGWSALSVGFLALHLAFSPNQTSSNCVQDTEACESFQPIYGGALLHHVFQTLKVPSSIYCLRACDDNIRCQSINHVIHREICELNNRTKEARPEAFTVDENKVYMNKFRERGRRRRFAKNFSHKTWVPGWILHESSCHGNILFQLVHYFCRNCDVALLWDETLKQGNIERFDKTST